MVSLQRKTEPTTLSRRVERIHTALKRKESTTTQNKTAEMTMITRVGLAMMMVPEARRQGVTLGRRQGLTLRCLPSTAAHNCCKRRLQAE